MLRDDNRNGSTNDKRARPQALHQGMDALLEAKSQFERLLAGNDAWRELRSVESRYSNGVSERTDGVRMLRDQLTRRLASEPAFVAWQFVEAALSCLALDTATREQPGGADVTEAAPEDRMARDVRGLASRIPTLERTDRRTKVEPASEWRSDDASTRFTSAAVGIEEAQVKIVMRKPVKPLIEFSLPPLPFARNAAPRDRERLADAAATTGAHHAARSARSDISTDPARPTTR